MALISPHTVNVKISRVINFAGEALIRTDEIFACKKFSRSAPYAKIFIPACYIIIITNIREELHWQYTAALRGSYIVDICCVLDCYEDTGVSQWTIDNGE